MPARGRRRAKNTSEDVPRRAPAQLGLRDVACPGQHTLLLSGELDMVSGPELRAALTRVCVEGAGTVVLDLSGLTFMDSTGIHAVRLTRELCAEHGCELRMIPGPAQVQRVFEIVGLLDQLPFRGDGE